MRAPLRRFAASSCESRLGASGKRARAAKVMRDTDATITRVSRSTPARAARALAAAALLGAPIYAVLAGVPLLLFFAKGVPIAAIPVETDRKSTRLNSSHIQKSRMPSSA